MLTRNALISNRPNVVFDSIRIVPDGRDDGDLSHDRSSLNLPVDLSQYRMTFWRRFEISIQGWHNCTLSIVAIT